MATYANIVVSPQPRGRFLECQMASGETAYPGMCIQIVPGAALVDNRPTYRLADIAADGELSEIIIVCEDDLQGVNVDTAYAAAARVKAYIPLPGDELQVLFNNVSGTADDVAIGDKVIVDDDTGKFNVTTGTPEDEPFIALEAITDPTADTLFLVRRL